MRIKMGLTMFIATALFLFMAGSVFAETDETTNYTDYYSRSLDLRYENLICKIDYTVEQINVIDEYVNDTEAIKELLNDKEELLNDKDELKEVYDNKNLTELDEFITNVLRPDFNKIMYDLKEFKENYKGYIEKEDKENFKDALEVLRDEYFECTRIKTREMSKLMDQYYKHRSRMWDQIIKSMNQRGLTTEEMEQVRERLQNRLQELEEIMNSGNDTQLREFMKEIREEHLQLWAKFHSGRLNSYLNRIEPAANKYGRSDEVKRIKTQLHRFDNLSDDDARKIWSELRNNADDIREMSKWMLKQRMEDNARKGKNR